jgi:hypothetical protein
MAGSSANALAIVDDGGELSEAPKADKKAKRKLSADEQKAIVEEVRERMLSAWEHERLNIEEAQIDQRFRANDQWSDAAKRERELDGRPWLTFNQMNTYVNQVVNPIKQADKTFKAKPDDNQGDPTIARVVDGLFKKIMRQSMGHAVVGHMIECQAGCSIGWVRLDHGYKDDESFEQEIFLKKVENPLSVFCDPAARDPVRSDAMWMAVTEMWPKSSFEARWPDAAQESVDDPATAGARSGITDFGYWSDDKDIRICEYYRKVATTKTIAKMPDGTTKDITGKEDTLGMQAQQTRKVQSYRVEKYMVTGSEVLEGPIEVPGCYIPLVPAVGGEIALDRGIYRYSVIRFIRDPQKLYNLARTAMAEHLGQTPKAPYLATAKMISRYRAMWDTVSTKNRSYLLYDVDKDAPTARPERVAAAETPVALIQDAQISRDDMKYGSGIHDASLGAKSQEVSGVALHAKQMESDVSNYHFADNLEATLTHIGRVAMSWIPVIYDTPRTILLVNEDGTEHPTPINTPQIDPNTGYTVIVNDLTNAKFSVTVDIGPSYSTRRIESAQEIGEFMKALPPQQAMLISDIYARNQEWEGHEEIADRLKATVPPQIIQASQKGPDGQPIQPPPEPPNPMMLKQLEKITEEIEKIKADAENAKASAAKTIVEAKQLDRQDAMVDFPGNNMVPAAQQPGGLPNYVQ